MKAEAFKAMIREIIREELAFESQASDDAKRQGLEHLGFGNYGKNGKTTHTTINGKLTPVTDTSKAADWLKPKTEPITGLSPTRGSSPEKPIDFPKKQETKKQKVISKVHDKLEASGIWQYPGQTMSMNDFTKRTGISRAAAKMYNTIELNPDFTYNEDTNSIELSPEIRANTMARYYAYIVQKYNLTANKDGMYDSPG